MKSLVKMTLPTGTMVKINGIPLFLAQDSEVETNYGNQRLVLSQSEQALSNPTQAAIPSSDETRSRSSL